MKEGRMMNIRPISTVSFKNSQSIKTDEVKPAEEKNITSEEYSYEEEQKKREQQWKEEQIKKQQDWIALINKPQTYRKEGK